MRMSQIGLYCFDRRFVCYDAVSSSSSYHHHRLRLLRLVPVHYFLISFFQAIWLCVSRSEVVVATWLLLRQIVTADWCRLLLMCLRSTGPSSSSCSRRRRRFPRHVMLSSPSLSPRVSSHSDWWCSCHEVVLLVSRLNVSIHHSVSPNKGDNQRYFDIIIFSRHSFFRRWI